MALSPPSLPPPPPNTDGGAPPAPPGPAPGRGPGAAAAGMFVAVFGLLLASFPARNPELWAHLAAGRALLRGAPGRVSPAWLYDVVSYGLFVSVGGAGLVAAKAGVVAALAVV